MQINQDTAWYDWPFTPVLVPPGSGLPAFGLTEPRSVSARKRGLESTSICMQEGRVRCISRICQSMKLDFPARVPP
jgi:hypothetical protein